MKPIVRDILKITAFILILPATSLIFNYLIGYYDFRVGILLSFAVYWIIILSISFFFLGYTGVNELFRIQKTFKQSLGLLILLPSVALFIIFFLPVFVKLKFSLLMLAIGLGIVNAWCEELFWRGLTVKPPVTIHFLGFISVLCFALFQYIWASLPGINLPVGLFTFLGGAFLFGGLWQFLVSKTNDIVFTSIAHALVNITVYTILLINISV